MRNLLILPDGSELISGTVGASSITSTTIKQSVNSGDELTLGSAFANILEFSIKDYARLSLTAGDEVTLYKVDSAGNRIRKGIFILEKPTRPSPNTLKLTGYDRVIKLDKDLTEWLNGLDGWPYELTTFAGMVCGACGLDFVESDVPNGDFLVPQFTKSSVTGRQIMKWLGEICCRFCRANANGEIEFAWYKPSGVTIAPTGDRYYFQGALSYEAYQVAPIEAVQLKLADSDKGALWPEAAADANSYIISGNAILMARMTEELEPYLQVIAQELAGVTYTPCKVAIPACMDIDAGSIVNITDKNGAQITAYVMTKTTKGQQDTLECTGSARRDSSTAVNNPTPSQVAANAFDGLAPAQVLNKLTDNGKIQGIYVQDSKWYINAEAVKILNLIAEKLLVQDANGNVLISAGDNAVALAGWNVDNNSISYGNLGAEGSMWLCRTGTNSAPATYGQSGIAGTEASKNGWCIAVGNNFGVDKDGALYAGKGRFRGEIIATSGSFTGTVTAEAGKIGGWNINFEDLTGWSSGSLSTSMSFGDSFASRYRPHLTAKGLFLTQTVSGLNYRPEAYITWGAVFSALLDLVKSNGGVAGTDYDIDQYFMIS